MHETLEKYFWIQCSNLIIFMLSLLHSGHGPGPMSPTLIRCLTWWFSRPMVTRLAKNSFLLTIHSIMLFFMGTTNIFLSELHQKEIPSHHGWWHYFGYSILPPIGRGGHGPVLNRNRIRIGSIKIRPKPVKTETDFEPDRNCLSAVWFRFIFFKNRESAVPNWIELTISIRIKPAI